MSDLSDGPSGCKGDIYILKPINIYDNFNRWTMGFVDANVICADIS